VTLGRTFSIDRFGRGFAWGLRGLVAKEVRNRSRGWRPVAVLTGYLVALTAAVGGYLALGTDSYLGASPWLGLHLFSALAFGAVLLLAFITPSLTAGAIAGERERRTLDLMLVSRASTLGLAAGKLAGSLLYVLFLLLASLPAFALVYLFGSIPVEYLLLVLAVAAATAIAHASLGLLMSALFQRTLVASVAGYLIVISLVFGLPAISTISRAGIGNERGPPPPTSLYLGVMGSQYSYRDGYTFQTSGPPPSYTYISPLVALSSVLPSGAVETDVPMIGEIIRLFVGGSEPVGPPGQDLLKPAYLAGQDLNTGQWRTTEVWAPWLFYIGGSLLFAPLAVGIATMGLTPRKPWRRLSRRRHPAEPLVDAEAKA
jgi:ABC-type transport system involved in multi-copper enzyme maturation permease subunit